MSTPMWTRPGRAERAAWLVVGSLVAGGCQASEVTVSFEQPGCVDYDFSDPAPEDYTITPGEAAVVIAHSNTLQACDASFEPEVLVEGKVITVREAWLAGTGTDCETCFSPTVTLEGVPRGRYELRWFLEDADYPEVVEEFRVE